MKKDNKFYWSISVCDDVEDEALVCVEDSATSEHADRVAFPTEDEAYKDGMENLKMYDNDRRYMLELYYFVTTVGGNQVGEYVQGYIAIKEKDGTIKEY